MEINDKDVVQRERQVTGYQRWLNLVMRDFIDEISCALLEAAREIVITHERRMPPEDSRSGSEIADSLKSFYTNRRQSLFHPEQAKNFWPHLQGFASDALFPKNETDAFDRDLERFFEMGIHNPMLERSLQRLPHAMEELRTILHDAGFHFVAKDTKVISSTFKWRKELTHLLNDYANTFYRWQIAKSDLTQAKLVAESKKMEQAWQEIC